MSNEQIVESAIDLLMKANKLLRKQADERQILFNRIITTYIHNPDLELDEAMDPDNLTSSEYIRSKQLGQLNKMITTLDHKEKQRDRLLREITQVDANHQSRDELISILQEYVDMEEATIYRLVSNYGEAQEILEKIQQEMEVFNLLSKNDPRLKALEALKSHPEGISMMQLSFMLGTTQYHAKKIVQELVDLNLVDRHNQLLHFVAPTEIDHKFMMNTTA